MSASGQAWVWHEFATRKALAKVPAEDVAAALRHYDELRQSMAEASGQQVAPQVLAVPGGTTPGLFFNELAVFDLPWQHIVVTLCDERLVPPTSSRSNERLVRRELLKHQAKAARFVPLYDDAHNADAAAQRADAVFQEMVVAVAVLGMGLDGHTASLFPDATEVADALDPDSSAEIVAIHSPSAPEPRLSMTLRAISKAWRVFLHIEGEAKRDAFERAMTNEPVLPIRAVVAAASHEGGAPVQVYWAP